MIPPYLRSSLPGRIFSAIALALFAVTANAAVIINEIMYRPGQNFPENTGLEYIELHNTEALPVNIGGWAFQNGVTYVFPAGTTIPGNGYLVIGGNPAALQSTHSLPSVLGPWTGTLSNNGERIELAMPGATAGTWVAIDEVSYASEGDWAERIREPQFDGWAWSTPAESGKSMEVQNPALSNDSGLNWKPSTSASGGTPGVANTAFTTNVSPIISDVKHSPAVPRSNEPVIISCELLDETPAAGLTVSLFWRDATSTTPGPFGTKPMTANSTGKFTATLDPMNDGTIVEFYVSATDGTNTRTWPAPTSEGQVANCQLQVDNESDSLVDSYYRLILTAAENEAFSQVFSNSDRQFNMTLVFTRAGESSIRYRSQMRIRGNSSRTYQFRPLRISIPNDDPLEGYRGFNLNPRSSFLQYLGMRLFEASGVRAFNSIPVELRRNGIEQSTSQGSTPDYGKWVRMEAINGETVDAHWPGANDGNIYSKRRGGGGDGFWRATTPAPSNPDGTLDGWSKQNNSGANDWSDLTNFFQVWQAAAAPHFPGAPANDVANTTNQNVTTVGNWDGTSFTSSELENVEAVADLDQWARWFAVMTILQDNETNISNGQDDDYNAYFVPSPGGQRRMQLLPHDLDTIFGLGDSTLTPTARGLHDMTVSTGGGNDSVFRPLLPLVGNSTTTGTPEFRLKYLNAIRQLYGTVFDADTSTNPYPPFYAFVDNHLSGWVPQARRDQIKSFATARQAHLLNLIGPGTTPIYPPAATANTTFNSTPGTLMIHEVLADNWSAHANGGTFPDVIEIYNAGASEVVMTGKSLTDDPALPARYVFPAGVTIPAGGYLVVYADAASAAPGLHTGFALDAGGDEVRLYDSAANGQTLLDSITFGPQAANFSIGRVNANRATWTLCTPTIGAVNTAVPAFGAPGGLRINEWLTNPGFRFEEDFVEIHNPATSPVALAGMRLTDDPINAPTLHTLPPLSFIGPGGYAAFEAIGDDATPGNALEVPFKIGNSFGVIALIGANGTIVDQVSIVGQAEDGSVARLPDGAPNTGVLILPNTVGTPGITNTTPPANILNLLNFLRISELHYFPQGNTDHEFIEFVNVGPMPLDLTGVRITNGIDFVFPPSSVQPGARILVAKSTALMRNLYGNAVNVIGDYAGRLDNNGERLTVRPPFPYEAAILNFRYESTWQPLATGGGRTLELKDLDLPPREYDESESWSASSSAGGTPALAILPNVNSELAINVATNETFTYQITASNHPNTFNATGLLPTLAINSGTGVISGSINAEGVYSFQISATNGAGTDTKTLTITVEAMPLPNITSAGTASTIVGDAFEYQITATNSPISYGATGLPNGLSINTGTGLISGAVTSAGTYQIQVSATNFGGTTSKPVTITVAASGPMAGFAWTNAANQFVNVPFAATLLAVDSKGRTVSGFNGNVAVAAATAPPAQVLITECGTGGTDYFEIQNVGGRVANTAGWFVVPNRASNFGGGVNSVHAAWPLPASIAPGEIIRVRENNDNEYPFAINWTIATEPFSGWCMLCDNTGAVKDFVAWVYTRTQLNAINFSTTVGGTTYNNITVPTSVWSGDGRASSLNVDVCKLRKGNSDSNSAADWDVQTDESNGGLQNPNLTLPFGGSSSTVPMTPTNVNVVNGTWSGNLSIGQAAVGLRLIADDGANHLGESNIFDVVAPPAPVVTSPTSTTPVVNQPFAFQLTANAPVQTWGATNLPPGLTFDPVTAVISGTPTQAVVRTVAVTATNVNGTGNQNLTVNVKADSDGDGMSDEFENQNGFSAISAADALQDADADGASNLLEFLAGTAPRTRTSRFAIISYSFESGSLILTWNSVSTRRYRVWATSNLSGPWTVLTPSLIPGVNGTRSYTQPSPPPAPQFYRVEAVQ